MNKQGNIMMTIIIALAFFMFAMLFLGFIMDNIAVSRTSDNLDCSNLNITSGNKIACIGVDLIVPSFIITIVIIGVGVIILKIAS